MRGGGAFFPLPLRALTQQRIKSFDLHLRKPGGWVANATHTGGDTYIIRGWGAGLAGGGEKKSRENTKSGRARLFGHPASSVRSTRLARFLTDTSQLVRPPVASSHSTRLARVLTDTSQLVRPPVASKASKSRASSGRPRQSGGSEGPECGRGAPI